MSTNHQVFLSFEMQTGTDIGILKEANGINGDPKHDNTTEVEPGDTMEWVLSENSNILNITAIHPDLNNPTLFSVGPEAQKNGWTATINPTIPITLPGEEPYKYHIGIQPAGGGVPSLFDPKIRVNVGSNPTP